MSAKQLNCQQARWSLYLARFDFELHHRLGTSMGKPDALSCHSDHGNGSADNTDIVLLPPKLFTICAVEQIKLIRTESDILRDIRKGIKSEEPCEELVAQAVKAMQGSKTKSLCSTEWSESEGLVYFHR